MKSEAEKRIREALPHATPGRWEHVFSNGGREHYVYAPDAHYSPTLSGPVKVAWLPYSPGSNRDANDAAFIAACSPENITALLADRDEREAALRAEVERLKAAIDMQPSPPTREDMEWAGKVLAEKENDALRAEVEALRRTATDRAGIIDSVREWTRGVVNDNWALRAEVEALRADSERLNFVEQTFIEEGSGLELYPFGVDEQYAEDGNTVIDRKFVFGGNGRVGPTLRAAIDAALADGGEGRVMPCREK